MSEKGSQAVKTVSFMMMITLLGKILGLVREQFLAANYAYSTEAAAFLLASRIPRTFFDVIFASAISASFIPIFVEALQKKGKEEAYQLANRFITLISTVTVGMMLVGMALAEPLTWLIAPGYDMETAELCIQLLRMLFPTMLFTAVDELPSRRVLSAMLGVNPNTIQKAYKILEDNALIASHGGPVG